jgi:pimeloyl-ACP methyl ester carboxylesterase
VALLVHGGADASTSWARVGPWLAGRGWDVIAVDLRGHGESALGSIDADRSFRTMADDLVETCVALRPTVRSVGVLLGHSLGATVALHCAVAHPAFVERLVLEDGPPGTSTIDWHEVGDSVADGINLARHSPEAVVRDLRAANPDEDAASLEAFEAAMGASDPDYVPDLVRRLAVDDIVALAERCQARTLLVVGRKVRGSVLVREDRRRFLSALASGTLVELDGGHRLHTQLFDSFVGVLDDWLREK